LYLIQVKLINIKSFDNPVEAHLYRTILEDEGIHCEIFDELTVGLNPLYNITLGGIRLMISDADAERASLLLQEIESRPFVDDEAQKIHCPKCRSTELYNGFKTLKGIKGFLTGIVVVLLTVYPFYVRSRYRCKACGTEFKN